MLKFSAENQQQKYSRSDNIISSLEPKTEPELDLDQINIWDLLNAFDSMMKATGNVMDMSHIADDTPIDLYQIEILHRLQNEGAMSFTRIFEDKKNRLIMVGLFLAVLELVREKLITAEQAKPLMPIYLRALTDEPAEQVVHNAMMARSAEEEAQEDAKDRASIPIETVEAADSQADVEIPIVEIGNQQDVEAKEDKKIEQKGDFQGENEGL
jgi:segregation and condensation protein A